MNVVAEVVLDDQGYPYVNWHETGEDFYDHYPVGTKFCVLQPQQEPNDLLFQHRVRVHLANRNFYSHKEFCEKLEALLHDTLS